jgi:hypothetical protein
MTRVRQVADSEPTRAQLVAAEAMLRMIYGNHISRAVCVIAELGIADLLADGPKSSVKLAEATRTHEPSLYRLLRLLASLGVLTEHSDRAFSLTILGDRLRADVPASMHAWATLFGLQPMVRSFESIQETMRTGATGVNLAHGLEFFDLVASQPHLARGFQAAMSERTAAFAASVAARYDFSRVRTVADVGGGKGTLLAAILRTHTSVRGVLYDLPGVSADAAAVLQEAGVEDRCEIVSGDFFAGVPAGADCYLLANVLHDWDDARGVQILSACRQAMPDDARLLIVERLIPSNPPDAVPVLLSDLNMLILTGGRERTNAEYRTVLAAAGLDLVNVQPVASPYGIIEAAPAPANSRLVEVAKHAQP